MKSFGSLFSGIGGFDLGFERAGLVCKWQVEIDPFCRKVLAKHWPLVRQYEDVTKFCRRLYDCEPLNEDEEAICPRCGVDFGECECIGTDQLLDECGDVDVICAGFPCTDVSLLNACQSELLGLEGEQSGLFWEVPRIIDELRPEFVVLENVSALLGRGMGDVLGSFSERGYDCEWGIVPASAFGALHRRERIYVLAHAVRERLEGHTRHEDSKRKPIKTRPASTFGLPEGTGIRQSEYWQSEPGVGRVADGIPNRVDRLKSLGNAVVPQIAEWIGRRVMEM